VSSSTVTTAASTLNIPRRSVRVDQLVQPRTTAHLATDAVTTRLRADPPGATARSMTRVRHGGGCSVCRDCATGR
jgi:hypothetical protein